MSGVLLLQSALYASEMRSRCGVDIWSFLAKSAYAAKLAVQGEGTGVKGSKVMCN